MRPVFDPTGGPDVLVEKMVGQAYEVVKRVYHHIPEFKRLDGIVTEIPTLAQTSVDNALSVAMPPILEQLGEQVQEAKAYSESASQFDESARLSSVAAENSASLAEQMAQISVVRWCGNHAVAPSTRLDGSPLQISDEYGNLSENLRYNWTGTSWIALNSSSQQLEERLANKTDGLRGTAELGHHGQNLTVSLQNRNGAAALKKFVQKLFSSANAKRINTRLVGTSISTGDSASSIFAQALCAYFGESKSVFAPFASQAEQPVNGWKTQYYSGTYSTRLRGGNGDSATPITVQRRAKSITIFYGKEVDGGSIGVSTQIANQNPVIQAPINCSGTTAINQAVTYTLDPNFISTIILTPPTTGFGYLEYYISDAGDYGMMFANTSYGGSGLWAHVGDGPLGTVVRPAAAGMYESALPSGELGFIATVAPTHPQVKPDLLIYSGPTNDAGNGAKYPAQLMRMAELAIANGSALILVIEPVAHDLIGLFPPLRAAYYAVADAYPDSVFVYDFDGFISWDLKFNPRFHNPNLGDPHPGDYGYGSPHIAAGNDMCQRLGVPFQKKLGRISTSASARVYTQSNEPMQAGVGSVWVDTSNGGDGVRKKLISRVEGWGSRGLWECDTGDNKVVGAYGQDYLIDGPVSFSARSPGLTFLGDPCVDLTGQTGYPIDPTLFEPGGTYTISYVYEAPVFTRINNILSFGGSTVFAAKVAQQAFVLGAGTIAEASTAYGAGRIQRFVLTVKWPTLDEQVAAVAAGANLSNLGFTIQGGSPTSPLSISKFRVEKGASVTVYTAPVVNMATTTPIGPTESAIEPLPTIVQEGGSWLDTSNTAPVLKHMLQKDCLRNIAEKSPQVFGKGVSLWRSKDAAVNRMADFITNATITTNSGGSIATKGNFGPGNRPGIRWNMGTNITNSQITIESPVDGLNLVPNAVYTMSCLVTCGRGDMVVDPYSKMAIYTSIGTIMSGGTTTHNLQSDLVSWGLPSPSPKILEVVRDQKPVRAKLTFKAYAAVPGSNSFRLMLLSLNQFSQWAILSDFQLELGASVTSA